LASWVTAAKIRRQFIVAGEGQLVGSGGAFVEGPLAVALE
jgi:hypothetical protein